MNGKRITALALSLVLAAGMSMNTATFAKEDTSVISPAPISVNEKEEIEMLTSLATVKSVENGRIHTTVGDTPIDFNTSEKTAFFASDFSETDISALKEGTLINVVHSPVSTKSIPAQMFAEAVVIADNELDTAMYIEVENVTADEDGTLVVYSEDGRYSVRVPKDASVIPYRTRNILGTDDISEGDKLICKVKGGVMTFSIPAIFASESMIMLENEFDDDAEEEEAAEPEMAMAKYLTSIGKVESVSKGMITATVGEDETVIFTCGGKTMFLDGDLSVIDEGSVEKGDTITVIHAPIMTLSIPAQIPATVVVVTKGDELSTATYIEVDSCEYDKDGNLVIESEDGNYIATALKDATVKPLFTKNIAMLSDISEGDIILCNIDNGVVTMSIPARFTTSNIVIIEDNFDDDDDDDEDEDEDIIGKDEDDDDDDDDDDKDDDKDEDDDDKFVDDDGVVLVPLRKLCKKLGVEIKWNGEEKSITIGDGIKILIGDDCFVKNGNKVKLSGKARLVSDKKNPGFGITYVPADLFDKLGD